MNFIALQLDGGDTEKEEKMARGAGEGRLFEGGDYFKYFRQREAINRGTAIIRVNTLMTLMKTKACENNDHLRVISWSFIKAWLIFQVIDQAWDALFHHQIKHREESWKYDAQQSIFDEFRGVWSRDETLCLMLDLLLLKRNDFRWRN